MLKEKMFVAMRKGFILFLLQFVFVCGFGQVTLTGLVTNNRGESLPGASVALEGTYQGITTNQQGRYVFRNLKPGNFFLRVSFLGYQPVRQSIVVEEDMEINFSLVESVIMAEEVVVAATRLGNKAPGAVTNLSGEEVARQNSGQDIPYQLSLLPSIVASSEAGNGLGYTALRIRGTGPSRINVTVNGIPLNDSESQGVFWVNMPDFNSSVDNIQVQRGVGASTNGSAAFGGTINFQTQTLDQDPYAEVKSVAGSFNSFRNTIRVGTGLIDNKFSFDARYSKLKSDGFVDYAFSDHESFFLTGAYYREKSLFKVNVFSGDQHTGISWWGNPDPQSNRTYNPAGEYTDEMGNLRYYRDQTDNYKQTHYQMFYSLDLNEHLNANVALHYTKGSGYYEQYKEDQSFGDYGLSNVVVGSETIDQTDLIRRKWLKNDFYGVVYSLNYRKNRINASFGGGWNKYDGDHFGNIIWARHMGAVEKDYQWYLNNGKKTDYNAYAKVNYELAAKLNVYGDLQVRHIDYKMAGVDDDLYDLIQNHTYDFWNPKVGWFYTLSDRQNTYFSFGIGHREPTRSNFKNAKLNPGAMPKAESLFDYELGYNFHSVKSTFGVNLYYMYYRDQLVATGTKNNVGDDIMTNVDKSYRAGVELVGGLKLLKGLKWDGNITLSRNRIHNFVESSTYYAQWNDAIEWFNVEEVKSKSLGSTHISYSPEVVASSLFSWNSKSGLGVSLSSKYVGRQYFDNTSSKDRMLDPYFVNNLKMNYSVKPAWVKRANIFVQVNNLFNVEYENNAYGGNWYEDNEEKTWAYFFPQAGINFLAGVEFHF
jgi:iron complex outermembrane receptor protein